MKRKETIWISEAAMVRLQSSSVEEDREYNPVRYGKQKIGNLEIFYREAGDLRNPAVVLLHGFPTSSTTFVKVKRASLIL
jgi:hypothetical protein